ncbi:hypothetical protein D8674_010129 [Pyrus ussuriensis x Pyrus communis]|uniref:Uncharacterized protein n=1 Tax=Pyrus ussuriensis x Pyrus communis TaxID=2448454 RepID=A0A5N5F9W1_9ROSA|nr:hypothetical protein D8674_010129 [Pyrus ussuriensis x Pyrus communis]
MGMPPDFPTPTAHQLATTQPTTQATDLVDQLEQNSTFEEPVVHPVIDPQSDAVVIRVGLGTILVEVVANSAATKARLLHPLCPVQVGMMSIRWSRRLVMTLLR